MQTDQLTTDEVEFLVRLLDGSLGQVEALTKQAEAEDDSTGVSRWTCEANDQADLRGKLVRMLEQS